MTGPAAPSLLAPRVLIPFLLVTLIWGSTWIVIRDQLGSGAGAVPPGWSVTYRFAAAAAAMFMLVAMRREPFWPGWPMVGFALMLGLAQFVCNFNFVYRAELYVTSGLVAVLFALLIIPNTLMGRLFLGTAITSRFAIGAGVALAGVGMMILHEYRIAVTQSAGGGAAVLLGTALTLAGVFSASVANVMQGGRFARSKPIISMVAWAMLLGTLLNAALAAATVGPPQWDGRPAYGAGIIYLGIIASAVAFPLYFGVIRAVGPGPAAWSSVLVPIIAMAISTLAEGYIWSPLSLIGGVLALAGMVIALAVKPGAAAFGAVPAPRQR